MQKHNKITLLIKNVLKKALIFHTIVLSKFISASAARDAEYSASVSVFDSVPISSKIEPTDKF